MGGFAFVNPERKKRPVGLGPSDCVGGEFCSNRGDKWHLAKIIPRDSFSGKFMTLGLLRHIHSIGSELFDLLNGFSQMAAFGILSDVCKWDIRHP